MSKLVNTLIASTVALAFAAPAFAGEAQKAPETVTEARIDTLASDAMTLQSDVEIDTSNELASGEYVAIEGPDGKVYYNRFIAVEDLPDPTLDLGKVETYDYVYNGMTFTNKIVQTVN